MTHIRDVLYLFGIDDQPLRSLRDKSDLSIEHVDESSSVMSVSVPMSEDITVEQSLVYRGNKYTITEIETNKRDKQHNITAEIAYVALNDVDRSIDMRTATVRAIANALLRDTPWRVIRVDANSDNHSITTENEPALGTLRLLAKISGLKLVFDTINQTISYVADVDMNVGFLFSYNKNIEEITKRVYAPKATRLIPYGRDGLTIESVNDGVNYVEDFSWYESQGYSVGEARMRFNKTHKFEDSRFIYAGNLMRAAQEELKVLSHPQIAYETKVSYLDVDVTAGAYGYVMDDEFGNLAVKVVRFIERERSEDNEVELDYLVPDLSSLQDDDGNTSSSKGTTVVYAKNEQNFTSLATYETLVYADVTATTDTHVEITLNVSGATVSQNMLLDGIFDVDGRPMESYYKQTVLAGYHTINQKVMLLSLAAGTHTIRFMLKSDVGVFSVNQGDASLLLSAENLAGGTSTRVPRITITEDVDFDYMNFFHVTEEMNIEFDDL